MPNLLTTFLQAASMGIQAKAQKDAAARGERRQAKSASTCTPCAAAARVDAYRADAQARLGRKGR